MVLIKKLESPELIEDACALLYKVYHEEMIWNFSPDNPSQLRVELKNNKKILVDRFTDKAVWVGAFDGPQLVGCTRLTFSDENNQLEMEGYKNSVVIQKHLPADKSRCAESSRTAVLKSHNGLGIVRKLFLTAFQCCENNQYSFCAAASNAHITGVLTRMGCPLKIEHAFKYEDQDPTPVNFYYSDYEKLEVKQMILHAKSQEKSPSMNRAGIFDILEIVSPMLPTIIYWHDTKGVVLGANAHCLKAIGATRDIIGKTPYDFYPKETAEQILNHHEQVIKTGEILSQDEQIENRKYDNRRG